MQVNEALLYVQCLSWSITDKVRGDKVLLNFPNSWCHVNFIYISPNHNKSCLETLTYREGLDHTLPPHAQMLRFIQSAEGLGNASILEENQLFQSDWGRVSLSLPQVNLKLGDLVLSTQFIISWMVISKFSITGPAHHTTVPVVCIQASGAQPLPKDYRCPRLWRCSLVLNTYFRKMAVHLQAHLQSWN